MRYFNKWLDGAKWHHIVWFALIWNVIIWHVIKDENKLSTDSRSTIFIPQNVISEIQNEKQQSGLK